MDFFDDEIEKTIPLTLVAYLVLFFICKAITNAWYPDAYYTYDKFCLLCFYFIPAFSGALTFLVNGIRGDTSVAVMTSIITAVFSYISIFLFLFVLTFIFLIVELVGVVVGLFIIFLLLGLTPSFIIIIIIPV